MKAFLNWRYYVLLVLFSVGSLATMVAFSEAEPAQSHPDPLTQTFLSLAIAIPSFYVLGRLMTHWSQAGLIPEILKHKP